LKEIGPNIVDVWEGGLNKQRYSLYEQIAASSGGKISMFTEEPVPVFPDAPPDALNTFLTDGTPLFVTDKTLFYWSMPGGNSTILSLEESILKVANKNKPPFFILLYGGIDYGSSPTVIEVAKTLRSILPNNFEIIGAQDLVQLALQLSQKNSLVQ